MGSPRRPVNKPTAPVPAEFADGLTTGPLKGRGAGLNPGNRFEAVRLSILGEFLDHDRAEWGDAPPPAARTVEIPDRSRSIINRVDSPDLSLEWTINPYRGCEHGCIYCYARPTHENLGMSCGLDFETKIVAKHDAPALLARELDAERWKGEPIVMSGVTDCYQPLERELRITRGCLEVMAERFQPVAIITKNRLVTRDLDLLAPMSARAAAGVAISITTLDRELASKMEPRASSPADRLRAIRELSSAGVPVTVMVAPIVPGLTDHEVPSILEAAADAGARSAGYTLLRLPWQVKDLFLDWLGRQYPLKAGKVEAFIREARGGDLYDPRWGVRRTGKGPRAEQIASTFQLFRTRLGLTDRRELSSAAFRKKTAQPSLFDAS